MPRKKLGKNEAIDPLPSVVNLLQMAIPNSMIALAAERAWVEIDAQALAHNIQALHALLGPQTALMAVIKANAYGHGAVRVAKVAQQQGVEYFGVATVPEGVELRQAGIVKPILVMGAVHSPPQIEAITHWNLEPTLCTPEQALRFSQALSSPLSVHLKLDTGMSRLGHPWQQSADFIQFVQGLPWLNIVSLYSHLATADAPDQSFMKIQQERFDCAVAAAYPQAATQPRLHLANSAGTLFSPVLHYDMVRIGLALYGIYPGPQFRTAIDLKPAMQVRARIVQVKTLAAGTGVSYNHRFIAPHELRAAVVGIGYADGVPRNLSNRMQVSIHGQRVPQIGTITMDQLIVDVTDLPQVKVGDTVTLLGQDGDTVILADEWADALGTIPYEIVCGFQPRLPRMDCPE